MTVRNALLALLEQGPMYGYQLRAEFERRTGATWPLNVGQVYTTLCTPRALDEAVTLKVRRTVRVDLPDVDEPVRRSNSARSW